MPTPSAFQSLPLHIAKSIVHYCNSTVNRSYCLDPNAYFETSPSWATLYNVCYTWRVLALQFFLQETVIDTALDNGAPLFKYPYLPAEIIPESTSSNYAKRVTIASSGTMLHRNKMRIQDSFVALPDDLLFPFAHTLSIQAVGLLYQRSNESSATRSEQFFRIIERTRSSMPNLQSVILDDMSITDRHVRASTDSVWHVDEFLASVLNKVTALKVSTVVANLSSGLLYLPNVTGLTRLDCHLHDKSALLNAVIAKSASTLETLNFNDMSLQNEHPFIFDDENRPITYPRLQKFTYYGSNMIGRQSVEVDKSVHLFPVLQHLEWHPRYVLDDYTPFRGNSATLQSLDIKVGADLVNILQRHKVFSGGKYLQLRKITVRHDISRGSPLLDVDRFTRFVADILSPATRYLSIVCRLEPASIDILGAGPYLKNLQYVRLTNVHFTLPEMFRLVQHLPNMTKLKSAPCQVDWRFSLQQLREFISEIHVQFHLLNHRLRRWELMVETHSPFELFAPSVLALAVVCPTFSVAVIIPRKYERDFGRTIKDAIDSGLYDSHKEKLQHIIRFMN